jgi:hypothetical protein
MALSPHESPRLTASKDYGALQNESSLTSVSKEALSIAADTQSNVNTVKGETDIVPQLLNDQKSSSIIPSAMAEDFASRQAEIPGNAPATELQPYTGSTVLIQPNAPTVITNTAEFNGMEIDLDVRAITI